MAVVTDRTLGALRTLLDQTGKSQIPVLPVQQSDDAHIALRTGWRRLFASMMAPLASFIRSVR